MGRLSVGGLGVGCVGMGWVDLTAGGTGSAGGGVVLWIYLKIIGGQVFTNRGVIASILPTLRASCLEITVCCTNGCEDCSYLLIFDDFFLNRFGRLCTQVVLKRQSSFAHLYLAVMNAFH